VPIAPAQTSAQLPTAIATIHSRLLPEIRVPSGQYTMHLVRETIAVINNALLLEQFPRLAHGCPAASIMSAHMQRKQRSVRCKKVVGRQASNVGGFSFSRAPTPKTR
jgi:hypothetical protein